MSCRKISLERRLQSTGLSEDQKKQERQALEQQERDYVRLQRQRMSSDDFEALKLIGRGAFGEVPPLLPFTNWSSCTLSDISLAPNGITREDL